MARTPLQTYRSKRDFGKTPEPAGEHADGSSGRFVVHKHSASSDHYDLRLELDGVLKSWAVPKGPSLNPADKRFAAETEDHPVDYLDFEGVIPEGEYGGGPIIVWDTGTWAPMSDPTASLASGDFKFRLWGDKLKGGWMLVRLAARPGQDEGGWLLFKERDQFADTKTDILATRPESVKTGRRIEELLPSPKPRLKPVKVAAIGGVREGPIPPTMEPQLATSADEPPTSGGWLHEIKFDGYRTLARVEAGKVALITRGGLDWTKRYGDLPDAFARLKCKSAVVDGEIVVLDDKGISRFSALQEALSTGAGRKLVFYAFDLIHLDGYDLRAARLSDRKALLAQLLAGHLTGQSAIQLSDHLEGTGQKLFERAAELGLEGIVSKKADSKYVSGRSASWIKAKARKTGDFVIVGYTASPSAGGLGALVVAERNGSDLIYRGKVGSGFDAAVMDDLLGRLSALEKSGVAIEGAPRDIAKATKWVRPVLVAHVHYATLTRDGSLRHAVFKSLREVDRVGGGGARKTTKKLVSDADLAGIWVTNPTRRLFGKTGATKLDVAVYYAAVGDYMLPHLFNRPVSLVRCPTGKPQDCFFQRHAFKGMPPTIEVFETQNSDEDDKTYLTVEDAKGFLALAQFGVVEFHSWGTHRSHLEKPDRIVFDLDPGEGIEWREVVEAAVHVGDELRTLGLVPFVKTSGGKGLHVVVPLKPKLGWKQIHAATGSIAAAIAKAQPKTFTTVMGATNRKRLIFIDFHRNARSATSAAPYTLRSKAHLPASAPLAWSDLESVDAPDDLNYSSLPGLLTTSGDPWADINKSARELPAKFTVGK